MKIFNVRLGFANNSSSTHSLIFLPKAHDNDVEGGDFGWGHFTAASAEAKRLYLAATIYSNFSYSMGDAIAKIVAEAVAGVKLPKDAYVDHQSLISIPMAWDGKGPDMEFLEDLKKYLLQDGLVILGGNDNSEGSHPLDDGTSFSLPIRENDHLIARRDERAGTWTVFNKSDGGKVLLSFDRNAKKPVRSRVPELVDIKITDFCNKGCSYCYQGSTPSGEHADEDVLRAIAWAMSELKVFEVALGGGEPTEHPRFTQVLSTFKYAGITPNFTTKSMAWLRDPHVWPSVIENIGGFAFSVTKPEEVDALAALLTQNNIDKDKASIQYVMGSTWIGEYERILKAASYNDFRITLLGFKKTGRGIGFSVNDYSEWLKIAKKVAKTDYFQLGIDTALASEYEKQLKKMEVSDLTYRVTEGDYSMYIDAVSGALGPSSYCDPDKMLKVKFDRDGKKVAKTVLDAFQSFLPQEGKD